MGKTEELSLTSNGLDFISALPLEECIRMVTRSAQDDTLGQQLHVWMDGPRMIVESGGQAHKHKRTTSGWAFRLEIALTPTGTGTHVDGRFRRNTFLDSWIALAGVIIAAFNVLAAILTLAAPGEGAFVLGLALIMQALFIGYYAYYRRTVRQQTRDLARSVYQWLTKPHGRYSKLL